MSAPPAQRGLAWRSSRSELTSVASGSGTGGVRMSRMRRQRSARGSPLALRSVSWARRTLSVHVLRSGLTGSVCSAMSGTKEAWKRKCLRLAGAGM